MEKLPKFAETKDLIHKGLRNLNKWHGKSVTPVQRRQYVLLVHRLSWRKSHYLFSLMIIMYLLHKCRRLLHRHRNLLINTLRDFWHLKLLRLLWITLMAADYFAAGKILEKWIAGMKIFWNKFTLEFSQCKSESSECFRPCNLLSQHFADGKVVSYQEYQALSGEPPWGDR